MGKAIAGLIVVLGIWVGVEFFTEGTSRAFDGAFAGLLGDETPEERPHSTAQRAGESVRRSHAEAEARRERMLAQ